MSEYIIETKNLFKFYGNHREEALKLADKGHSKQEILEKTGVTIALHDVNLKIPKGEIFVIIGLSGSGKSTLVRCFNRLNRPSSGSVFYNGTDVVKMDKKELLEYRRTQIAMVFQSFGLMSHRSVLDNVTYGLEVRGVSVAEREKQGRKAIALVGLTGYEDMSCLELSGGMRQRVGLARALANDPEVLLMDEPFSALDPLVRQDMQFELLSIQRKLGKTVIFITHDIDEAFKIGDRVAIMRDGKIVQVGTPMEISANPKDEYVERFIQGADKSKVWEVDQIMIRPCIVRGKDVPSTAIDEMRRIGVSTAFVIGERMKFEGIVEIKKVIQAHKDKLDSIEPLVEKDIQSVKPGTLICDVMPLSADSHYPVPVVDDEGVLLGIITKTSVLSSLV